MDTATSDAKALQYLLDKSELYDLVMKYARYTDRRDMTALRALYHDDAIEDRGKMFKGPIDEFIKWVSVAAKEFELTMHRISNTIFEINGNKAQGEIYAEAYHRTFPPDQKDIIACGRYLDHYEKRDGIWKFTYRTSTTDRCEIRPVDPIWYKDFVAGSPKGIAGADDPSYKILTMFKRWERQ
ncbi:MAG: nuclear transport factor 2 family protein [Pseudomonadota bacterium]